MSSNDIAVSVRGLSKSYTIVHNVEKHTTAAEALMHRMKNPKQQVEKETFWALREVDFDVRQGDVLGIVGRNGAGKSTLLKVLSRITEPTTGIIDLFGRVGSLLEVGTGFHPELTGRENIFLNGAILGMSKREISKHFDAIVDFAEVEKFLDTPVKRYSSGMYVRLAFAVAAHLNSEILIIDEVLAVGDASFQKKCLGKMQNVSTQEGRTILFVSHNMQAVRKLCNRAILLKSGKVLMDGKASEVADHYFKEQAVQGSLLDVASALRQLPPDDYLKIHNVCLLQEDYTAGDFDSRKPLDVIIQYELFKQTEGFRLALDLADDEGNILFRSFHDDAAEDMSEMDAGVYVAQATLPAHILGPKQYEFRILAGVHNIGWCMPLPGICIPITVDEAGQYNGVYVNTPFTGILGPSVSWSNRSAISRG